MDIVSPETRSRMMASIRGADTSPELFVRKILHSLGFRFRLHHRDLPGRPDIVLPKHKLVIFVHGCFWHQHPGCRYAYSPKSNRSFWRKKLRGNVDRDRRVLSDLQASGWRTVIVWECLLRKNANLDRLARDFQRVVMMKTGHTELPKSANRPSGTRVCVIRRIRGSSFLTLPPTFIQRQLESGG
jgi:DNA mismatch endonuclease (patch repair protein)